MATVAVAVAITVVVADSAAVALSSFSSPFVRAYLRGFLYHWVQLKNISSVDVMLKMWHVCFK